MTTIHPLRATCGLCGRESEQHAVASTSVLEPPDLDTRPGELMRSTLAFQLGRCPGCGYVADPELSAPADAVDALGEATREDAYRALGEDRRFPELARRWLCRAFLDDALDESAAAGWAALHAAWACDDAGALDAAGVCRRRALDHWDDAQAEGEAILADAPAGADLLLVAETLRRAGRFDEAVASADAARAVVGGDLRALAMFIADRACAFDQRTYTTADAERAEIEGDPTSRRVPPLLGIGVDDYRVMYEATAGGARLELRRRQDCSVWVRCDDGVERQLSVWEAFMAAHDRQLPRRPFDVLDATRVELELWSASPGWSGRMDRPDPDWDAPVRALFEEWRLTYLRQVDAETAPAPVDAAAFHALLDRGGEVVATVEHRPGGPRQLDTVAAAVGAVVDARPADSILVLEGGGGYVQVLARRARPAVYLEAVDTEHQSGLAMTGEQRDRLRALGWADPKAEPIPYAGAHYPEYWSGGNLAREVPTSTPVEEIAALLLTTLRDVYGLSRDGDLRVRIFDAIPEQR